MSSWLLSEFLAWLLDINGGAFVIAAVPSTAAALAGCMVCASIGGVFWLAALGGLLTETTRAGAEVASVVLALAAGLGRRARTCFTRLVTAWVDSSCLARAAVCIDRNRA